MNICWEKQLASANSENITLEKQKHFTEEKLFSDFCGEIANKNIEIFYEYF